MRRDPVRCGASGCQVIVKPGQIMCKGHWFSLPKPLRDHIWSTWRTLQAWRGRSDKMALAKMIAAYRDAVLAAKIHLEGVPPTPAAAMCTTAIDSDGKPVRYEQGRMLYWPVPSPASVIPRARRPSTVCAVKG